MKNDESDKELLDVIENNEEDKGTKIRFHSDPDALLTITYMDMQILSISFRTSIYRLYIRLSLEESLLILFLNTSADGKNDLMGDITKIIELWRCVCIDGEAVDMGEAETAQSFVKYLSELSNHEGKSKQQKAASSKASSKAKKQKRERETIIRTKPARFPDAGQYKGIHEVEDGPETIVPVGKWSIQVSPGRSYTMDPEYIRSSFAGQYILQIQSTEDRNFDKAFDSDFNLVIFPSANTMDAYSALTDLSSDEAADAMMEVAEASGKGYSFFKRTKSLVVMIKTVTEKQKEYSVMFLVFSRGTQLAANGQIVVRGQTQKMAKEEVEAVLNSIAAIGQPEGEEYYKPFALPEQFGLTYHNHQILRLDDVITLPIPDGFKASTDRALIGGHRKFAIVPEDFDDFSNAMDAFIGINSVAQGQLPEFTQEDCDEVVSEICRQLISNDGFGANIGIVIAQMTTKGIIFYQRMYGMDTNKYVMGKVVIWTDRSSYSVNFALNFDEAIADRLYVNIDAEQIIADWLNRIELPGDKLYYIPSESEPDMNQDRISNLICPPAPEVLHEHFDLVTSGGYTTRRDADFIGQSVRKLMEKCGTTDEDAYDMMTIAGDNYELNKTAKKLAQLFRLEKSLFDPYTDQEALIRLGAFSDVRMLHALRSLSWTASRYAAQEHCSLAEIPFADLQKMSDLIEKRNYLNYDGETGFVNLCNHYDWHVFYVPDAYLSSSTAMQTDLRYLTGKENRGGNTTMTVFLSGTGTDSMRDMHHNNEIISRNEETMESLESLRKDLEALLPVMQTIYEGFIKDRNRREKLEGALADALTAWCALAVAAKEPFYSEEATDTPEANAGLGGPLERPTDDLDDLSPSKSGNAVAKQTTRKKTIPLPKGEMLDLEGETVIKSGQFAGNMTLQNIIIPEGVTEIGEGAFYSCMLLETVAFPKSLRKIGKMAFMSCRSLKQVELPEGVEELETHVFGATNNLKEVHLPDSLKKVDRCVFGLGGDSPYATAYLSGKLAKQLYEVNGDAFNDIYARHIIIDGTPYDSVKAYLYTIGIHAKGYYPPYDPEVAARAVEERARREEERQKQYRPNMEAACKAGKPLQEMIEAGRQAVNANEYGDKDAFEQAIKNLDKTATVTFEGKHFVLSGFGIYEEDVIAEIEKRGGIIHSSMVKMADYLVVCLESPGAVKLKKALEWRQKGASNLIVSDYQMWQAIFGKMDSSSSGEKKSVNKTTTTASKSKLASQKTTATEKKATPVVESTESAGITKSIPATPEKVENDTDPLKLKRRRIIQKSEFLCKDIKTLIIPEGVTEIRDSAFLFAKLETLELPSTLRIIGEMAFDGCPLRSVTIKEGLESIGSLAFGSNSKLTDIYLPDSIQNVDRRAFSFDAGSLETSYITVHMSGETACRLEKTKKQQSISAIVAKAFIIDGKQYEDIKDYVTAKEREEQLQKEAEERVRQEQARHEREEAERKAAEARKQERKKRIQAEIQSLTSEMNSLRGLFAGLKRKKLQARIDELNEQLRRL